MPGTLRPTSHAWIPHNWPSKPFLGHFAYVTDTLSVPTFPTLGGSRKTAECIILHNPPLDLDQPHSTSLPQGQGGLRKTALKVSFSNPVNTTIMVHMQPCKYYYQWYTVQKSPQPLPPSLYQPLNTAFPILTTSSQSQSLRWCWPRQLPLPLSLWSRT